MMRADAAARRRARPCSTSAAARASWRSTPAQGGVARPASTWRPFFLPRAAREVDLVLGDLRRLPFRKGALPARLFARRARAPRRAGRARGAAARRAARSGPRGRLFVYTHAMESSRLASFQRCGEPAGQAPGPAPASSTTSARRCARATTATPIRSHEHFDALCAAAGPRAWRERRYYNVVFKAVVEDLLPAPLRAGRRRGAPRRAAGARDAHGHAHGAATRDRRRRRPAPRRCWRSAAGAHLAPQARRGPLRRHPHGPVLRPARAAREPAREDPLRGHRPGGAGRDRRQRARARGGARAGAARGHEVHAVVRRGRRAASARRTGGVVWHRVALDAARIASSASARGPRSSAIAARGPRRTW